MLLAAGTMLEGKYRVERLLGAGGMGSVWIAEHTMLGRPVAVKVLDKAAAAKDATAVTRFMREAQTAARLRSDHIVDVLDVGRFDDGTPFLIMELLEGETLSSRIRRSVRMIATDAGNLVDQLLDALGAAHAAGVIHRDVKPDNCFILQKSGRDHLKLLDFGISKVAGADDLHLTRTGMVMGTPFYMSPEQARGDRNLDHRVDIYACGVMLYECLTGRRPFHAANYNALLMQILTTSPRPTTEVRPAVPDAFEAVVAKAMQRDREKRYQNASEMQRDVQVLRDPAGQMRRPQSVPPEPVPLVTHRRRDDGPVSRPKERPKPVELPPVSIDIEGRDLLDSGLQNEADLGDSGSIEIPIVAEAPVSAKDIVQRPPASRPMYKPDPAFAAKHPPPAPERQRSLPPPIPKASGLRANVPATPKVQPRANVQQPPPIAKNKARIPTPSALDAPWLDEPNDPDPTEIGSIYSLRSHDAPIDADSTERIPPERLARIQAKRSQQPQAPSADRTERVVTDKFQTQQLVEHLIAERVSDDEAPTTLFDRRAIKGKLGRRGNTGGNPVAPPRTSTTERSPAPTPSAGRPPSIAPLTPPPLPRFRGPKDG